MARTQVTQLQLDNYGPWTVTPEPRREMDLQTLQSRLYADVAQFVGSRDGYAFFARADNMVAVTNGMDRAEHALLQESLANRYPVSVSLGVGVASRPIDALETATERLQSAGSAQSAERREVLAGEFLAAADGGTDATSGDGATEATDGVTDATSGDGATEATDGVTDADSSADLQIAHFDVDDATGKYTDQLNEFDTFVAIESGYAALMRYLRETHGALAFFVGGDNVIAACPDLTDAEYRDAINHVEETAGVELKVGVGTGATAHAAGMDAKHALETCRHDGTTVEFD